MNAPIRIHVDLEAMCIKFLIHLLQYIQESGRKKAILGRRGYSLFNNIIIFIKHTEITITGKVQSFNQSHSRNRVQDYNTKSHVPVVGMAYGEKNADYIQNQDRTKKKRKIF